MFQGRGQPVRGGAHRPGVPLHLDCPWDAHDREGRGHAAVSLHRSGNTRKAKTPLVA